MTGDGVNAVLGFKADTFRRFFQNDPDSAGADQLAVVKINGRHSRLQYAKESGGNADVRFFVLG